MVIGSALVLFAQLGEGDTLGGDFIVELCDVCDEPGDDRLVDKRPKSFGGLQLRGVGWQINEANAIGDFEISWPMPPRIVEHEKDDAAQRLRSRGRRLQAAPRKIPSTLRWKHTRRFRLSPVRQTP